MRRTALAALLLTAWFPLSATAASVTVRSGETLSDIANRYGVSVGTLMRMNGIRNPDLVQAGSRLQVPGPTVTAGSGRHRVNSGETLSSIASRYQVRSRDLMALNNLRNANHVEVGQTLRLPSNAVMPRPAFKPVAVTPIPGATEHTVAKGQTLTQIAKAYKLPVASLISINQLSDPNKVEVGTRLYLTDPSFQTAITTQAQPATTKPVQAKAKPVQTKAVQTKSNQGQCKRNRFRPKNQWSRPSRSRPPSPSRPWPNRLTGAPMARSRWTGATGRPWVAVKWCPPSMPRGKRFIWL